MSFQTHGLDRAGSPLVRLSGKTFQKFPSGLIRVDQTFACRIDRVESARGILAQGSIFPREQIAPGSASSQTSRGILESVVELESPFYIFPSPKESYDTPGFCKFDVSGYSYARNPDGPYGNVVIQTQLVSLSQDFRQVKIITEEETEYIYWTIFEEWRVNSAIYTGVTSAGAGIQLTFENASLTEGLQLVRRRITGELGSVSQIPITWTPQIISITRRNFGRYDEFDATQTLLPILQQGVITIGQ